MAIKAIICLDGCSPDYLAMSDTPNLDALASAGFYTVGQAIVPTVTNVNNTTIVTASFPELHGITSNYSLDRVTGKETYMESSEFLLVETIFRRFARRGQKPALLTAKDKLKTLIQDGATIAESAERPSAWLVERIGAPPDIYSLEVNHWLLQAARQILKQDRPDLLYVTTTDYPTHSLPPEAERSQWNMHQVDRLIGDILNMAADMEIVVTADHGMNPKTSAMDLGLILRDAGIPALAIPIIKDRYVVHHHNLGGAAYVYLDDLATIKECVTLLREERGVEEVLSSAEAAERYRLHPERIGDLFVLADADTVFGALPGPRQEVSLRSHGSLHEREIPIYAYGPGPMSVLPKSNDQVALWVA